jgi:hypothetical protein
MSDEYVQCELIGGRYEGDTGGILPPLPDVLWAFACHNPACTTGNRIHWVFERDKAPPSSDQTQSYRRGPVRSSDGVQLYVHSTVDPDLAVRHETLREPELLAA